jgi:hypothetical protein
MDFSGCAIEKIIASAMFFQELGVYLWLETFTNIYKRLLSFVSVCKWTGSNKQVIANNKKNTAKVTNSKSTLFEDIFIKDYTYFDIFTKKEIWQELAKIVDGNFEIISTKSYDLNSFKLDFIYKSINIDLFETDTKPLKINFNFKLNEPFEFSITLEDYLDRLMKFFGRKELEIHQADFDNKYFIQTNNTEQVKSLFEIKELSDLILKNDIYGIHCSIDKELEQTKIITIANRNVDKLEQLVSLVKVQQLLIDRFYENDLIKE